MPVSDNSLKNLQPFKPGQSGNPKGKAKGTISVVARIKKRFKDNPEMFEQFLDDYMENKQNHKHLTEMIDGKPKQSIDAKVEAELTINVVNYGNTDTSPL